MHAKKFVATAGRACFPWLMAAISILLALAGSGPARAGDTSFARVEKGRYLVLAGDCAACHTAEGGKPFAGGRAVPTPFGNIYSTNITPDQHTGIGTWSEQDFYRAMHEGIDADGNHLYPAFPYPWFTKLTRDDVGAIKAFLDTLVPVEQAERPPELAALLSWRASLAAWNALFFNPGTFQPSPGKSAQWNRGAYLVEGAGHCSACHAPKNLLGATRHDQELGGGDAGEHWYAPSLAGDLRDGIGGWSASDIVDYLKTGANAKSAAAGPMAEVVTDSTQYLSDADLQAMASYLKDMPARQDRTRAQAAAPASQVLTHGEAVYLDNCIGCHMVGGDGLAHVFPALGASAAIQADKPDTLIHVVLSGAAKPATQAKPVAFAMPSFGDKLNDTEVADLVTFIRNAWGNRASAVSAGTVASVRKDIGK